MREVLSALSLMAALPVLAAGQVERSAVVIDYANADGIYLPIGADRGLTAGDTVDFFGSENASAPDGRILFTTVMRRRSLAQVVEGPAVGQGSTVYLELIPLATDEVAPAPARDAPPMTPSPRAAAPRATSSPPTRFSGRLSLDVLARETRTSWSGDLFGETTRRYATPTSRLSLHGSNLPGGFELRANLRGSYRYMEGSVGPPPTSIRAYELSLTKTFEGAPLTLMAGRFTNPYERFSGYWDGALLRVGGRRFGVGVVAGFDPLRGNEPPSGQLPKVTGFMDLSTRGDGWRFDSDVSVHLLRPDGTDDVTSLGWTQRIVLGPVSLQQRIRADGGLDGRDLVIRQARVRAGLALSRAISLRGTWEHRSGTLQLVPVDTLDTLDGSSILPPTGVRDEISAGVSVTGTKGSIYADAGESEREGYGKGRSLSLQTRLRVGAGGIFLSGRRWSRDGHTSMSLAPGIDLPWAGFRWRGMYRRYLTETGSDRLTTQAADLQLRRTVRRSVGILFGIERQWGENLSGTRLLLGLSRSF